MILVKLLLRPSGAVPLNAADIRHTLGEDAPYFIQVRRLLRVAEAAGQNDILRAETVMLGDDVVVAEKPCLSQLIEQFDKYNACPPYRPSGAGT